jgi:Fe-S cluster assembly iron-binding protein IscA
MLQVTEKATSFLWEAQRNKQDRGMTYRLVERRGGFGLAFDTPTTDDLIFTCEGGEVLCVSPTTAECASDLIIDLEETSAGPGLTFSVRHG